MGILNVILNQTAVPLPTFAPPAKRGASAVPRRDPGAGEPEAARQQLQLRQDRVHPAAAAEVGGVAGVAEGAVHGEVLRVPHLREEPGKCGQTLLRFRSELTKELTKAWR